LHIISSDADQATNLAFRVGQWFGVNLGWRQTQLNRTIDGDSLTFEETALDTITVGNFAPFRTGRLKQPRASDGSPMEDEPWRYETCVEARECLSEGEEANHIWTNNNEPLAFIQTDSAFISDHNDVFSDAVTGYLGAILSEARAKRLRWKPTTEDSGLPEGCRSSVFSFGDCFRNYQQAFMEISAGGG